MLNDAQIERYGRQILLPEVGGQGQARLLAATVAVVGRGIAAEFVTTLLGRAGVGRLHLVGTTGDSVAPDCTVVRHADSGDLPATDLAVFVDTAVPAGGCGPAVLARGDARLVVALPDQPCAHCWVPPLSEPDAEPLLAEPALAWTIGSLAAAEALRLLLRPGSGPRLHRLHPAAGGLQTTRPVPSRRCAACGATV